MSRRPAKKKRIKLRTFYIIHKYMGIGVAIFVLLIAITGVLLNHTDNFKLGQKHVQSDWILDWYGIKAPNTMLSFLVGNQYITLIGEGLYLNTHELGSNYRQLTGAIWNNGIFVITVNDGVLLLTKDGEQIDYLHHTDGVPAGIKKIGIDNKGSIVVKTSYEGYQPDDDFFHWQRRDEPLLIHWASPSPTSASFKRQLQQHLRKDILPVERVILDLHSGRFFGRFIPWLFDLIAIVLILLALSGTWIWLHRKW